MVQRTSVRGINRYGRASQGVRVMNLREDDQVSAIALVVESEAETAAPVVENGAPLANDGPVLSEDTAGADAAAEDGSADDSEDS
jgi:DNA gyrase subunit A